MPKANEPIEAQTNIAKFNKSVIEPALIMMNPAKCALECPKDARKQLQMSLSDSLRYPGSVDPYFY